MKKLIILFIVISGIVSVYAQPFSSKSEWEQYFIDKIQNLEPIEGIWSNSYNMKVFKKYNGLLGNQYYPQAATYAIYKVGSKYMASLIESEADKNFIMFFENTANSNIYLTTISFYKSHSVAKANAVLSGITLLEFSYEVPLQEIKYRFQDIKEDKPPPEKLKMTYDHEWIKIFPQKQDYEISKPLSGTGFAISSTGIIATNYHVVEDARTIKVRGVNSDFNRTYKAKTLVSDKNNDLALIQIDDYGFTSLGTILYTIKTSLLATGENIFVLGYPLRATMGDEIKLTNGIISSKTGFQGDITSYQISAPVQPGNSGGPLFDSNGNLTGIINAKHLGAENASYAIKVSYLMNLIELLPSQPKLPTLNKLTGKTLPNQVGMIKQFVYIIEVE